MIRMSAFGGADYQTEPHLLDDATAQQAVDCWFETGSLGPIHDLGAVDATLTSSPSSIYRFAGEFWFSWSEHVDVVQGPVPGDTEERTYFTGYGAPKMTMAGIATSGSTESYPTVAYDLGVPAPDSSADATVTGEPDDEDDTAESRVYTYTFVSAYGEEGPPAPPSSTVHPKPGQSVELGNLASPPTGNRNIDRIRVYRSATAAGDTEYLYLTEIEASETSIVDDAPTEELSEPLPSMDWDPPPGDMEGLVAMPNGVLAGHRGKEVCFSEPYYPHAWPVSYRLTMDHPVVGLATTQEGLVVATTATPYIVSAAHPSAASMQEIEHPMGCVSGRGMVDMGEQAWFPTAEALVAVGAKGVQRISDEILGEDNWKALHPETIHAYRWRDRYIAFYDGEDGKGGFMVSPGGSRFTFLDLYADSGWTDPETGDLFLLVDNEVWRWNDTGRRTYRWRSKDYINAGAPAISAARVDADEYPVTLRLFADGEEVAEREIPDGRIHRLPATRGRRFAFELEGTATVYTAALGQGIEEVL
ncbi:MAG: hypothetical protein ACOCUJ_04090 [Thiohalospira sp.]